MSAPAPAPSSSPVPTAEAGLDIPPAIAPAPDLEALLPRDRFDTLDREFAAFLLRLAARHPEARPGPSPDSATTLALAAALVSQATREGHVCIHLGDVISAAATPGVSGNDRPTRQWIDELAAWPVVGRPGDFRPLILDSAGRLYLQRYWNYEDIVARGILERVQDGAGASINASESPRDLERSPLRPPSGGEGGFDIAQAPHVSQVGRVAPRAPSKEGSWPQPTSSLEVRPAQEPLPAGAFSAATNADAARLNAILDRYFPPQPAADFPPVAGTGISHDTARQPDWQRLAVSTALTRRFCVISGGPGTGKTYTIAVVIAALLEWERDAVPRIALAAPTGKAAIRLQEAMQTARDRLPCPPELRDRLPTAASTVHRLLGTVPGSTEFRHNAANPLPFDMIVVDEASMVDLALMARLLQACRPATRVVLVGDMNQLASVEAGAVLGDICDGVRRPEHPESAPLNRPARPSPPASGEKVADRSDERVSASVPRFNAQATARGTLPPDDPLLSPAANAANPAGAATASNPPLAEAIVQLRRNRRFRDNDGIASLSRALNAGDSAEALSLLRTDGGGTLAAQPVPAGEALTRQLLARLSDPFQAWIEAPSPGDALQRLASFRILCALRRGPHGTETLNAAIEKRLRDTGRVTSPTPFYPGRPILVLKNDYNLRLFNGDVGVVLPHPETRELRVWFPDAEGNVRDFAPGRLPDHETVFAMTVHKSQGSEFQKVLMILPDRDSPVLTRELIYTGVTRARQHVELWFSEDTLTMALARRTRRTSGLAHRLWGDFSERA